MSIAGIRSNRGDVYQTLVALNWALTTLSNPEFDWIEVDSVTYLVDDVVIGKADGSLICCQCKKNQTHFEAWSITDLKDELVKAACLFVRTPNASIRFYSRNPFGALAKLKEHSTTQSNETGYRASLTKEHQKIDAELVALLVSHAPGVSTYEFLSRVTFDGGQELDRMEEMIRERLRIMASNPDAAFDALWRHIDQLGGRMAGSQSSALSQHRLTKDDLKRELHKAGAMLVPAMDIAEVRTAFVSVSAIGRSWRRDISGRHIPNPVVGKLLDAIDTGKRSILLTGLPGSGKTCVMLALQEALEYRAQTKTDIMPLFIQSHEFSDLATARDRAAQGLPEQWVENAARMADGTKVVVVIDSLDVLSIAREHSVLTYFLAQIDRLLLISNITVVTACRDFDRHYDRRIAERKWDYDVQCPLLTWETEIEPLLLELGIQTTTIDTTTRELIHNPRELALFVELAQRSGSFNVVNSQALALRYLDTVVLADPMLGAVAMEAIEGIAEEMLLARSLTIPHQRAIASQEVIRRLCSLNVLQETHDGKLTFGHQTLLDVLVISGAIRKRITLNKFIQDLPPVPFVRPSIRSFVAQLATGERREFRKQVRTVLTGNAAFHIRRLVAESFAEQIPQDDDWSLIRDLHNQRREVFQVIYTTATHIDWHHFWLKHLVPVLKDMRNTEGLTMHAHRITIWKNSDPGGVLTFWSDILSLDFVDSNQIASQLPFYLVDVKPEYTALFFPLLKQLLNMPTPEHSFLGQILAGSVKAGSASDEILWRFVAGDITDDDVLQYGVLGNKLRCHAHEFGGSESTFFRQRMQESSILLDLVIQSVEQWSRLRISNKGAWMAERYGFLGHSSYRITHNQSDIQHVDAENVLLDAMEAAILHHAEINSDWWLNHRERLCFSHEGVLRYFAIRAFTNAPQANIEPISQILSDRDLLESDLIYEAGNLIGKAFIYLDVTAQDAVMQAILTLYEEKARDDEYRFWMQKKRADLVSTIPCHLRSPATQKMLDDYEKSEGLLVRQPDFHGRGGTVSAPFSFEIFLDASDGGVIRLLRHYAGHERNHFDFLVGGEREVGWQLREAASRAPTRFLSLLSDHWIDISASFRNDIMDGVANHLAYRFGELQANGNWKPLEEPDPFALSSHILDELERHSYHWHHNRSASNALQACAHVIQDTENAARLVFLAVSFVNLHEESAIKGDSVDFVTCGINMITGNVAEALMILACKCQERAILFPDLLPPTLRRFASNKHPAIRALVLRRLSYLQSRDPDIGWDLFQLAMQDASGLWQIAEPCLYYSYYRQFERVSPLLIRIFSEGGGKDRETWGRISALAALVGRLDFTVWLEELKSLDSNEAWVGAASVWTHPENLKQHRDQCIAGLEAGLSARSPHAEAVAHKMEHIFRDSNPPISIPIELIRLCFIAFESDSNNKHHRLFGFHEWLNAVAQRDPDLALAATEIYLSYVKCVRPYLYDHNNNLTQLMTRLFAEAEEREESDGGEMLLRVAGVQDGLLALGLEAMNKWLEAVERQ
jgi:hypothetical protein